MVAIASAAAVLAVFGAKIVASAEQVVTEPAQIYEVDSAADVVGATPHVIVTVARVVGAPVEVDISVTVIV
jgi:hypothetical protein